MTLAGQRFPEKSKLTLCWRALNDGEEGSEEVGGRRGRRGKEAMEKSIIKGNNVNDNGTPGPSWVFYMPESVMVILADFFYYCYCTVPR